MLLLLPGPISGHYRLLGGLLLGLLMLFGAIAAITGGGWLRLRWVNATALALSVIAAVLIRAVSHTQKIHTPGLFLMALAIIVAIIAALRTWSFTAVATRPQGSQGRVRVRKRKRRLRPAEPNDIL